ncbi:MAG TPA: response regulator [Vicinamibacteria bacterium]|nr:response regulator [Vicinamibacteria bacterium]
MGDTPGRDAFDPSALPDSAAPLPDFDDIPEALRQVLVVDDNAVFRGFLRALLQAQGFTVYEATNGGDGLALALEKRPWLILTDVRMPGDDGFELCRRVRSHSLIRQTPLLFLSGWDDSSARFQGLELGADDFVSKDTPVRELLIRIQLTLKRYIALGRRDGTGRGMEGRLEVMGAPGVLQACHLTRLTGLLTAQAGGRTLTIRFRDGEIVGASGDGHYAADAVYAFLAWPEGRFQFAPGDPGGDRRLEPSFSELVLEGCRRLDEAGRGSRDVSGAESA